MGFFLGNYSERLLLDSDIPIVEIAERCGVSDIKYYTSNFKTKDTWIMEQPAFEVRQGNTPSGAAVDPDAQLICISVDEKTDLRHLVSEFSTFQEQGFIPTLIIHYNDILKSIKGSI